MARARNLKPGFFKNADLLELPMAYRLLFAGLWTVADRAGRLEDKPKQVKIDVFPGDDVDCDAGLAALAAKEMLLRYEVGGKRYVQLVNFKKHQNPHKDEKPSTIPPPPEIDGAFVLQQSWHGASTVQAQCSSGAASEVIGLTPDSLFPDSLNLSPDCSTKTDTPSLPREGADQDRGATKPGAVCVVLKSEGIATVNPGHQGLLDVLESGATLAHFVAAAGLAKEAQKPTFAYVLGIVKNQLLEGKKPAAVGQKNPSKRNQSAETFRERDARLARDRWEAQTGKTHPDNPAHPDHPDNPARHYGATGGGGEIIESQAREIEVLNHEH